MLKINILETFTFQLLRSIGTPHAVHIRHIPTSNSKEK